MKAAIGDPAFLPAQGADLIDPAPVPLGTKNDLGAVGRKGREVVIGGVGRPSERRPTSNLLDPDIGTAVAASV